MTAAERRHRRWFYTFVVMGGLVIGSVACGVYRTAVAQSADAVPVVVLPSAVPVLEPPMPRLRSIVIPVRGELPLSPIPISIPMPELVAQAPELLPLPKEVPPPAVERAPIENPVPVTVSRPSAPLSIPPLNLPKPTQIANPMLPATVPPPDLRLHSGESGHNVKSTGPIPAVVPPTGIASQPPAEVERIIPPVVSSREAFTAIPAPNYTTPQLEPPMPMSLRRTALSALLGTALVTGTMFADSEPPAKTNETAVTKKEFDETNKLLAEIKRDIADLKTKDIADIKKELSEVKSKDVADMKKELDALKEFKKQTVLTLEGSSDKAAGGDGLLKKMSSLDDKLTTLTKQLDSLDKKLSETSRTALASPFAKDAEKEKVQEKEKPKSGTVKIVNMYSTDVDVLVNGKGHRLPPQETKSISITAGTFTYQLLTAGGAEKTRTIKEGEEVTLLIN